MDEGLVRTSTIADGGKYCDFRYKRVEIRTLDGTMLAIASLLAGLLLMTLLLIVRKVIRFKKHKIKRNHEKP
jgi:hypothetical protein